MARPSSINPDIARQIKLRLWNGDSQQDIASEFNVSQATISRIKQGKTFPLVHWPNGNVGSFPADRLVELSRAPNKSPVVAVKNTLYHLMSKGHDINEIARKITEEAYKKEEGQEAELIEAMRDIPRAKRGQGIDVPGAVLLEVNESQWTALIKHLPNNKFVRQADEQGDAALKSAVFYVLTAEGADKLTPQQLEKNIATARWNFVKQRA